MRAHNDWQRANGIEARNIIILFTDGEPNLYTVPVHHIEHPPIVGYPSNWNWDWQGDFGNGSMANSFHFLGMESDLKWWTSQSILAEIHTRPDGSFQPPPNTFIPVSDTAARQSGQPREASSALFIPNPSGQSPNIIPTWTWVARQNHFYADLTTFYRGDTDIPFGELKATGGSLESGGAMIVSRDYWPEPWMWEEYFAPYYASVGYWANRMRHQLSPERESEIFFVALDVDETAVGRMNNALEIVDPNSHTFMIDGFTPNVRALMDVFRVITERIGETDWWFVYGPG